MELGENLSDAEIEELIIGAINKPQMLRLGIVNADENSKDGRDYDETKWMVTKEQFMKILRSDVNDDKIKIPKK